MVIKWKDTKRVKLHAPRYYRTKWTVIKTEYGKAHVEQKEENGKIHYDVCLQIGRSWGWTRNLKNLDAVENVIKNKMVSCISSF